MFSRLSPHHYQTGWVLCCVGRAFFEMVDYPEAAKAFNWARQVGGAGYCVDCKGIHMSVCITVCACRCIKLIRAPICTP